MTPLSTLIIGNQSLTIECAKIVLARGHGIAAVVTGNAEVAGWATAQGLRVETQDAGLAGRLGGLRVDWLLSIANLVVIPPAVLACAGRGAVNFHDGPLPDYAGLNAPVWAIMHRAARHGITWHLIGDGIDDGDILLQQMFDIAPDDTALTLNTRCFAAAIDSFPALLDALETGAPARQPQDMARRRYFGRAARPPAAALLDFGRPAAEGAALVRALDHGSYANPLTAAKIVADGRVLLVGQAAETAGSGAPGTVLARAADGLLVACGSGALRLSRLTDNNGEAVSATTIRAERLEMPQDADGLTAALATVAPGEPALRRALAGVVLPDLPFAEAGGAPDWRALPLTLPVQDSLCTAGLLAAGLARSLGLTTLDLAYAGPAPQAPLFLSHWAPLRFDGSGSLGAALARFDTALTRVRRTPAFALDLIARDPALRGLRQPRLGLTDGTTPVAGTVLTLSIGNEATLHWDAAAMDADAAARLAARLVHLATHATDDMAVALLPLLPDAERAQVLDGWNATATPFDAICVHQAFEAQVRRTPDALAVSCEGASLTYAGLNARANRAAHVLAGMGVAPGTLVGLCVARGIDLVVGALAIQKAGGAYVPMDPAYPPDRIALYLEDSAAPVLVTQAGLLPGLPPHGAATLLIDSDPRLTDAPESDPDSGVGPGDLAYMIYTSGSTGRPKGVMIEHRNVANFFTGMDARLRHDPPGVWLAVTSLSFDISVLELFWTLARGFRVVLTGDENRALVSSGASARGMEFSLYYWGNDDGAGQRKYDLLLEGAKYADANGFCAVWTPERHFHAFGGPYPNPAVTGAAVAAVTRNIGVRAGSCVAPLHHPARIAEDWAVIDNLTGGRAGLAMASGWQPDDFVLRPENTPPNNKAALFAAIDQVRRLWRGEAVEFPTLTGTHAVITQPRPVSAELPVWVTTAGNPDTWREAGSIGANVLTHLLGQTVAEVQGKIVLYHQALRAAGHDPARHKVTLMLHTYVAADRAMARATAREPMKDYLRSAAGLIKQYAWAFPAFKRPQGVADPAQIDLRGLDAAEMDAILEFAFERYFEDSGLFGTVDDCVARVDQLKAIGVDEIACLIDYGIAPATVLAGLRPLAEVLRRANATGDHSIAAEIIRQGVTHLQCTPSMARMIAMNDDARGALARVEHLLLGGEALPGSLVADLRAATGATITNMYGPTETTIWSTTATVTGTETVAGIGTPIANTQVYVLDAALQPLPAGVPGELWIGGAGVARGYWRRDDLTAERFRPNPFAPGRIYRTGDLAIWRADGTLGFLGRADDQVKLRGYRIELGEIEAALAAQPGVRQAVVVVREDVPGDLRLVAYVVGGATEAALRPALAAQLPAHMVPAHFVALAQVPLTPNRKIDRKALPAPQAARPVAVAGPAPTAGMAAQIAAIWARVLGVPRVTASDNFFAMGGHSLLAVQVHREIRDSLKVPKLSITDIFRFPTLAALAAHLDDAPAPVAAAMAAGLAGQADARADAMARRRAMRAGRTGADA